LLTLAQLRALLHYDVETRVFRWLDPPIHQKAGDIAGSFQSRLGYRAIVISRKHYREDQLALFYLTGIHPDEPFCGTGHWLIRVIIAFEPVDLQFLCALIGH
jgi:hypothetical protein